MADFQIKYHDHTSICQSKIKYLGIEWVSDCCLTPTRNRYIPSLFIPKYYGLVGCGFFMVFSATFNNIVAVSFIGGGKRNTGGNHRPATSHWQTLSHNVVHLTLSWIWTHNISGDRHRIYNGQGKIRPEYERSTLIYRMHKMHYDHLIYDDLLCDPTVYNQSSLFS